jgi:TatD DNase family protein
MILKTFPYLNFHTHPSIFEPKTLEITNYIEPECIKNTLSAHSIGLHPWYIGDAANLPLQIISINNYLAKKPEQLVAIGETGLDKLCNISFDTQKKVFQQHITWSEQYQKPLIIHCVRAYQEVLAFRKIAKPTMPWVLHGFDKNVELAIQLYRHEFRFSLGAALLHPQKNWATFFQHIPLTHIFLETDDRTDISIYQIYKAAAKWASIDEKMLKQQVFENYLGISKNLHS